MSTARATAAYLRFQLGDGTWEGHRIVSAVGLRSMHAPAVPTPPGRAAESTTQYGFGWAVGRLGGQDLLAHDGDATDYHANMALLPDSGQAIVVLTARNGFFTDPSGAYRAGLQALAGSAPAGSGSASFVRTYAVIDAVAVLTVAGVVLSLRRRRRWAASLPRKAARRGRWGALAPTVVADVLLAVGLYVGVFV